MEDVKFDRSHSNSPLPEAGNEPEDPLAPELDEENGVNPPLGAPDQDMEVTEGKEEMPDPDDIQEAGLSDNESVLSDVDEQFLENQDFNDINIEERPAEVIDSENLNRIGVHKRKRAEGEGEQPKKKKRADKPRRKKNRDDDIGDGDAASSANKSRSRKKASGDGAGENDENLTPEERMCWLPSFQLASTDHHNRTETRSRRTNQSPHETIGRLAQAQEGWNRPGGHGRRRNRRHAPPHGYSSRSGQRGPKARRASQA